jgi:predicted tellurium resistance membrane protein TerC
LVEKALSVDNLFVFVIITTTFAHPYIVFAANAFALLGLRELFFLVHSLLGRLVYLSAGLAVILAFMRGLRAAYASSNAVCCATDSSCLRRACIAYHRHSERTSA